MKIVAVSFTCPCCGSPGLSQNAYQHLPPPPWKEELHGLPPYSRKYGDPSYEVCGCCGFEFGNDDDPGTAAPTTFREYLSDWIARGCTWFDPKMERPDWNLPSQLAAAGITGAEKKGDPAGSDNDRASPGRV